MNISDKLLEKEVRWLNEKQVAAITGLSVFTLRNDRCQKRRIPYYKVGRSVRYLYNDIIEFMGKHMIRVV